MPYSAPKLAIAGRVVSQEGGLVTYCLRVLERRVGMSAAMFVDGRGRNEIVKLTRRLRRQVRWIYGVGLACSYTLVHRNGTLAAVNFPSLQQTFSSTASSLLLDFNS